jgi:hypothetical protein
MNFTLAFLVSLQEEFAPFGDDTGVAATEGSVESLRGRMSEAGRQVEELFESLLAEAFACPPFPSFPQICSSIWGRGNELLG